MPEIRQIMAGTLVDPVSHRFPPTVLRSIRVV